MNRALFGMQLIIAAIIGFLVMLALGWLYKNREKFNPVSDQNYAYQGASSVVNSIAENLGADSYEGATLGTRIMDAQEAYLYNPVTQEIKIPIIGPVFNYGRKLGEALTADDPVSENQPPEEIGVDPLSPFQVGA